MGNNQRITLSQTEESLFQRKCKNKRWKSWEKEWNKGPTKHRETRPEKESDQNTKDDNKSSQHQKSEEVALLTHIACFPEPCTTKANWAKWRSECWKKYKWKWTWRRNREMNAKKGHLRLETRMRRRDWLFRRSIMPKGSFACVLQSRYTFPSRPGPRKPFRHTARTVSTAACKSHAIFFLVVSSRNFLFYFPLFYFKVL